MRGNLTLRMMIAVAAITVCVATTPSAQGAVAHAEITGSGSISSANAVNQWIADVTQSGLHVVFTAIGSAQGRKDFTNGTTDFGVSDLGFQGVDQFTSDSDTPCQTPADYPGGPSCRQFAYTPIVAGGTSFPYHLKVGGNLVRNVRLSGATLAKIFTGQITNWSDAAITADMNGKKFPSIPIVVVVHSEGSGSTAQFTRYLNKQFPSVWQPYVASYNALNPDHPLNDESQYFPPSGSMIEQNGSDGVINYITSGASNGAIGYDEYSYALAQNYPVVKLKNAAGVYTAPTPYNVAVALTHAQFNQDPTSPDYGLANLDAVYSNLDGRTYPLSSVSYMLIPTSPTDSRMTTAKRQTVADYLYYSICQGQAEMGAIGYSPLPLNVVQESFAQLRKLKDADPNVDLTNRDVTTCNNPTFIAGNLSRNHLSEIAPMPATCDKSGQGPCDANGNPPPRAPSAPRSIRVTPHGTSISVSWLRPASNGSSAITGYTATITPTGTVCRTSALTCTFRSLNPAKAYRVTVAAHNSQKAGPSAVSGYHRPGVPTTPRSVSISPRYGSVIASWKPPSSSGASAIRSFTATAHPSGRSCKTTTLTCRINGLVNGREYYITVVATKKYGASLSARSTGRATAGGPSAARSLKVSYLAHGRARVSWSPAAYGGIGRTSYENYVIDNNVNTGGGTSGGGGCSAYGVTSKLVSAPVGHRITVVVWTGSCVANAGYTTVYTGVTSSISFTMR